MKKTLIDLSIKNNIIRLGSKDALIIGCWKIEL